jgi:hypothetical protein
MTELEGRGIGSSVADILSLHMNIKSRDTHTTFSSLPTELRLQIWLMAIPPSTIHRVGLHLSPFTRGSNQEYAYTISSPRIPVVLHICHESRTVGLKLFSLGFSSKSPLKSLFDKYPKTYWNPKTDALYLPTVQPPPEHDIRQTFDFGQGCDNYNLPPHRDDSSLGYTSLHSLLSRVQHLALPWNDRTASTLSVSHSWLPVWLSKFESLKSVCFLIDHFPQWYRAGEIVVWDPEETEIDRALRFKFVGDEDGVTIEDLRGEIEKRIRETAQKNSEIAPGWEIPEVELLVMGHRKRRTAGGFCIKRGSAQVLLART